MELILSVFDENKVEAVANIVSLIPKDNITCTVATRSYFWAFRIFKGSPEKITWTCEGYKEANRLYKPEGIISWASAWRDVELLIEVRGETKEQLLKVCMPFIKGLRKNEKGIVTYWSLE